MLASFDKMGKQAVAAKELKEVRSFTTAENQATEQAAADPEPDPRGL